MIKPPNTPLAECLKKAEDILTHNQQSLIFQTFTCAHCDAKQTIHEPNHFYTSGRCEECSKVTEFNIHGCGFTLILTSEPDKLLGLFSKKDIDDTSGL